MIHPFDRSGVAALSDLETVECRQIFEALEAAQREFLAHDSEFRASDYKWPRDALHWWSRCWEYPYAYHHIRKWRFQQSPAANPTVVDLGSGVTFFPPAIARLGCHVVCLDTDPVCVDGVTGAARVIATAPGSLVAKRTNGAALPMDSGSVDLLYCISVLEHIPTFLDTVGEFDRVVRPGGIVVLTVDLDLTERSELGVREFRIMRESLAQKFELLVPERSVHPGDILLSDNGPHPMAEPFTGAARRWFQVKQRIKPLVRRKALPLPTVKLAVHGSVWKKK